MAREKGCQVRVLNAGKLRMIYDSIKKTDENDAINLNFIMRTFTDRELPAVYIPTEKEVYFRALVGERDRIMRQRTMVVNAFKSLFCNLGFANIKTSDFESAEARQENISLLPKIYHNQANRLDGEISFLDNKAEECYDEEVKAISENIAELTPILSVPGIAVQTALSIYAYFGNMQRFNSAKQVVAFAGRANQGKM